MTTVAYVKGPTVWLTYTVKVGLKDAPPTKPTPWGHWEIAPDSLTITYYYPRRAFQEVGAEVTLRGRNILKGGRLGREMRAIDVFTPEKHEWIMKIIEAHRPNWSDILKPPYA